MAKELPYFKFEPNQWENGNIQMLSRDDKGLFIDLCSMYWSRLGDLPFKLAVQKLCAGNATALNSLCDEKIIEVIDANIFIKFLSEQLNEFEDVSKQNSKNAKDGWEKRRKQRKESERNATALKSQCESDAIREDKKIEEDIIEYNITKKEFAEIIYFSFDDFWSIYPNKTNKAKAQESFNKIPKADLQTLETHLNHFINNKPFKEYSYPHATTYLNQKRYKDEIQNNNLNNKENGKSIINTKEFNDIVMAIRNTGERR